MKAEKSQAVVLVSPLTHADDLKSPLTHLRPNSLAFLHKACEATWVKNKNLLRYTLQNKKQLIKGNHG